MTDFTDARHATGGQTNVTNIPTEAPETDDLELEIGGERALEDQGAFIDQSDTDTLGSGLGHVEMYEGELEAGVHDDLPGEPKEANLELLTELELRAGETDNPHVAAEEGLTYIPPMDPPVVPGPPGEGPQVAAGFGASALDEPYDEDHHSSFLTVEDEFEARIREALRADAATSDYADAVVIGHRDGTVVVRGAVDDVDDTDEIVAVIERVTGVVEVIDEMEVRALDRDLG